MAVIKAVINGREVSLTLRRTLSDVYRINNKPMLAPDNEQSFSFEDIDASDSGRTEDGVMHRSPVRYNVGKWGFEYSSVTEDEKQYMESLFPDEPTFEFTHPDRLDSSLLVTSTCYRSKYSINWFSSKDKVWKKYSFNIIEC